MKNRSQFLPPDDGLRPFDPNDPAVNRDTLARPIDPRTGPIMSTPQHSWPLSGDIDALFSKLNLHSQRLALLLATVDLHAQRLECLLGRVAQLESDVSAMRITNPRFRQ
jgi:hypothetical protein